MRIAGRAMAMVLGLLAGLFGGGALASCDNEDFEAPNDPPPTISVGGSGTVNTGARVTLSIGERRFELIAGLADAWATDARADAAIVAAMSSLPTRSLTIGEPSLASASDSWACAAASSCSAAGMSP